MEVNLGVSVGRYRDQFIILKYRTCITIVSRTINNAAISPKYPPS